MCCGQRSTWRVAPIALAIVLGAFALVVVTAAAFGQEHHKHPPQDQAIHERFYNTWMRPNATHISCCDNRDCYPTKAKFENGSWYAERREDGAWLKVPEDRIEMVRDNPDGRNHLCAPAPDRRAVSEVYCFMIGGGT